jgi:undecaprenyl-diphosphatase
MRILRARKPRVLLSGAFVSFVGYMALAAFAAEQQLFALDYGTRAWVKLLQFEALQLGFESVTQLGDRAGLIPLVVLAMALLWRRHRRWAVALPVLMIGAWALQLATKWAANRPRPNLDPWGFPSGHVLSLVVFFGLMVYLIVTASKRRRRWRLLACAVCVVTVMLVGFSRLYLDRHWLSDVAGGLTVGTAYLLIAIWIVEVVVAGYGSASPQEDETVAVVEEMVATAATTSITGAAGSRDSGRARPSPAR